MNALRLLVAGGLMVALTAGARAEKKPEEKKDTAALLVGKWEAVKVDPNTLPVGDVVEFTKDGKFKHFVGDKAMEGTYKVEGDKFTITMKRDKEEMKMTITIKKLTDKELVAMGPAGSVEFKKK